MLNQCLLANRRAAARLLLLLHEEALQQEALLRLQWEESVSLWRRSQASHVVQEFRWAEHRQRHCVQFCVRERGVFGVR